MRKIETYIPLVKRTAYKLATRGTYGVDLHDLESVGMESLWRSIQKLKDNNDDKHFYCYARQAMTWKMIDRLRDYGPVTRFNKKPKQELLHNGIECPMKTPDELAESKEILDRCQDGLTPRMREVFRLHFVEGKLLKQTGEELGITESRVSQIRRRMLEIMRGHAHVKRVLEPEFA